MIFYEAPHHLRATLRQIAEVLGGGRRAAFGRELTKRYEEFRRGTLQELCTYYAEQEPRGEYVLIVEGFSGEQAPEEETVKDPVALCHALMESGLSKKDAMREAAKRLGIARRDVYNALLQAES